MQLKPFQVEDGATIAARTAALVAHEPRVGKTLIAVRAADLVRAKIVVVVCPAAVRENWRRAIEAGRGGEWSAIIVSYNKAARLLPRIRQQRATNPDFMIDVLVIDESHMVKDRTAKRTRALYGSQCDRIGGLAEFAKHVYCLTGTPQPNHPGELWPMLRALAPELIDRGNGKPMSLTQFKDKYCKQLLTPFGVKIVGSKNAAQLRDRLSGFVIRRTRAEVFGRDLQPPTRVFISPATEHRKHLRELESSAEGRRVLQALERGGMKQLSKEEKHVASLRRLIGLAKVPGVVRLISEELDAEPRSKQVLFAYHREVCELLVQGLRKYGAVVYYGGVSADRRIRIEDGFRTKTGMRVVVGQLDATSVGLDFSAADVATLVEQSWVGDVNQQAFARIFNMNSDRPKFPRFAVLSGSIDENIVTASERKLKDSKRTFG